MGTEEEVTRGSLFYEEESNYYSGIVSIGVYDLEDKTGEESVALYKKIY